MQDWTKFHDGRPDPFAMVLYYIPDAKYVWGTGGDYDHVKIDYPQVTHWKVIFGPPPV